VVCFILVITESVGLHYDLQVSGLIFLSLLVLQRLTNNEQPGLTL